MADVYVVMGTSGEYSDRTEWPIAAYANRGAAGRHEWLAAKWVKDTEARAKDQGDDEEMKVYSGEIRSPYDPQFHVQRTWQVDYYVMEVPVREAPPEEASDGE